VIAGTELFFDLDESIEQAADVVGLDAFAVVFHVDADAVVQVGNAQHKRGIVRIAVTDGVLSMSLSRICTVRSMSAMMTICWSGISRV
jgi:hypothetical protein